MATKKRQQTINKRNRERAIEEKRTLKRQAKQEKREAIKNGEVEQPDWLGPPNEQLDAPGAAPPTEPKRRPPEMQTRAVELEARETDWEYAPGHRLRGMGFNGSIPGPLIEAEVGDTIRARLANNLPEPTTIHWHGLRVPAAMDGTASVQPVVEPGESFDYDSRFRTPGPSGTTRTSTRRSSSSAGSTARSSSAGPASRRSTPTAC